MQRDARLSALIQREGILLAPGCYDALTARLIEKAGFEALYMTGAGVSISTLGIADVGLTTLSEMLVRVRQIADAVNIPLIADADTGYGNALNVYRTVKDYERAGASAIQIEDQETPKKCGHELGRRLISIDEMRGKIHAALDARSSSEFLIIARTDARTDYGLADSIERAKAYEEAGADILFVESVESIDEMREVNRAVKSPTLADMVEGGRTPLLSARELENVGFKIAIFPNSLARVMARAAIDLLSELRTKGTTGAFLERMLLHRELFDLFDFDQWVDLESKYLRK